MKLNLAIFGGSFDPIHYGHLRGALEVVEELNLQKIIFLPCVQPAYKEVQASTRQRMDMVKMAIADNDYFAVSDLETQRSGYSYTYHTLLDFKNLYPGYNLTFLTGADAFFQIHTWFNAKKLFALTDFVVMDRPGSPEHDLLQYLKENISQDFRAIKENVCEKPSEGKVTKITSTLLDISSSEIKRKVQQGKSIKYLLPEAVENYIKENRLYFPD